MSCPILPCNFPVTQLCLPCIYMFVCVCVCARTHARACLFLSSRSSTYPFSDSPLYSQTPSASSSTYYESTPSSESDITSSVTSQPVSVATAGANSGGAAASGGGYVIQGSYVLGGVGGGGGAAAAAAGGGGQSYSSPNSRAPPATVSIQVQSEKWLLVDDLRDESSENLILRLAVSSRCSGCVITTRGRRG